MAEIGITRRDHTPRHWRDDYPLTVKAKKMLLAINAEKEDLHMRLAALPAETPDDEYDAIWRETNAKLDELTEAMDRVRRTNPR